jgi:ankyrin repeat protein
VHGHDKAGKVYRNRTCAVLNVAAYHGDIDLFDHLVARGAAPSRSNALHYAASCKNAVKATAMITHLIETYHFDPNASDSCGGLNELLDLPGGLGDDERYPLDFAVSGGTLPAVEALLKFGADPSNSIREAIEEKQATAVKILLEAGADCSKSFPRAVTKNFLEGAELCLQYGADPADAEHHDKELAEDPHCMYEGMTPEMRKLLDEWKLVNHF